MPSVIRYVYAWASSPTAYLTSAVFFVRRKDAEEYLNKVGHGELFRCYTQNHTDSRGQFISDKQTEIIKRKDSA